MVLVFHHSLSFSKNILADKGFMLTLYTDPFAPIPWTYIFLFSGFTRLLFFRFSPLNQTNINFIHKDFLTNTWSPENTDAYFPRPRGYASYSAGALGVVTDRYLQDVSYLRLKNLTIGYTLPLMKDQIEQIKLFASGENLFYWSALKKNSKTVDPELTNTSSTYNNGSGVGYSYSKSYSVGVNITF